MTAYDTKLSCLSAGEESLVPPIGRISTNTPMASVSFRAKVVFEGVCSLRRSSEIYSDYKVSLVP